MFPTLIMVIVSQVYIYMYLKAYQIVYFKYMQLTVHSYTSGLPEWLTCQFWGHVFHPGPERFHMM